MKKRLVILTALAFAAITAPASAFLSVNEAIYVGTVDSGNHFRFKTAQYFHPPTSGNDQQPVGAFCDSPGWTRISGKGGCWFRSDPDHVYIYLARAYLYPNVHPTGAYYMSIRKQGGCIANTAKHGHMNYYNSPGHVDAGDWYKQYC